VVLAKWMLTQPDVLILDEPTRGIDVGAKYEIYCIIAALAKQGKSIIMISSELPELMAISDRFVIMAEGHVACELTKEEAREASIMHLATKTFKNVSKSGKEETKDE